MEIPYGPFTFRKVDDSTYWFYNGNSTWQGNKGLVTLYDTNDSINKAEYFPVNEHLESFYNVIEGSNFNQTDPITFFCNTLWGVYELTETSYRLRYTFDFLAHNMPDNFLEQPYNDIADFAGKANAGGYVYFITNLAENDWYLIFSYRFQGSNYWGIYNKLTKKRSQEMR